MMLVRMKMLGQALRRQWVVGRAMSSKIPMEQELLQNPEILNAFPQLKTRFLK